MTARWFQTGCLLLTMLGFTSQGVVAVAEPPDSRSLIAALNYNFAKYADWPNEEEATSIRLCFFTANFQNSFAMLKDKLIFDKPVTVSQLSEIREAGSCNLVYIDRSERDLLQRLFVYLQDKPVLTVSDITGFVDDGGMIEILKLNNKFRFKVNLTRMQAANVKMSSQVLKLAVDVK